ncbi:MAG: hypothetical protein NVSMB17_04410 [Candidatus Dormibacteria bacterium]
MFLSNGLSKFLPDSFSSSPLGFLINSGGARGILKSDAAHNGIPAYRALVEQVILPNWGFFGPLLGVSEVTAGVLLCIGLLTPVAAGFAALMSVHINFATYGHEWLFEYAVEWVPLLVLAAIRAGRFHGLDARLARRRPSGFLW